MAILLPALGIGANTAIFSLRSPGATTPNPMRTRQANPHGELARAYLKASP